jgi:hypothetical protein
MNEWKLSKVLFDLHEINDSNLWKIDQHKNMLQNMLMILLFATGKKYLTYL